MIIENSMYFALGILAAGLLALMIMPLISRRTARLTRKRIEAATPITLTEFKADKDQLRAEFAMSTRRLEMNVETLRNRLTEQLNEINTKKANISTLKNDRHEQTIIVSELEDREEKLRNRILETEKEASALAQKLRTRDRELADSSQNLSQTQATLKEVKKNSIEDAKRERAKENQDVRTRQDNYAKDMAEVKLMLESERRRADFLEEQVERMATHATEDGDRAKVRNETIDKLRNKVAQKEQTIAQQDDEVTQAEAKIASAESRLNALLQKAEKTLDKADEDSKELTSQNSILEKELSELRNQVSSVEETVLNDWDSERLEQRFMRERLNDIANNVSKLIHDIDGDAIPVADPSVMSRARQKADTAANVPKTKLRRRKPGQKKTGGISSRMEALRDIQTSH